MLGGRPMAMAAATVALAVAGCGGGDGGRKAGDGAGGARGGSAAGGGGGARGGGASGAGGGGSKGSSGGRTPRPADRESTRVIRGWSNALRRGRVERATDYFALPSVVENASPPMTLNERAEARAFNTSLPCGARLLRAFRIGRYTAAVFVLTERPGGDCGTGTGNQVATAFVIRRGRILEWRRLADPSTGGEAPPEITPGTPPAAPTVTGPKA